MSEELRLFGTSFPTPENDNKDYIPVWKQKAVSAKGTKRLHGAFEGGFSAGYFNTVGSKEGWKPSEFVSSRDKRIELSDTVNNIERFMDEDDLRIHNSKEVILLRQNKEFEDAGPISSSVDLFLNTFKVSVRARDRSNAQTSGACSGGGAWDEDETPEDFENKKAYLHKIEAEVEKEDLTSETPLSLIFDVGFVLDSQTSPLKSILPDNYVPVKIIGKSLQFHNKTSQSILEPDEVSSSEVLNIDEKTAMAALRGFMPFSDDPEKQSRYVKYLRSCLKKKEQSSEPVYLDEKEREEFIMSAQIFKPSSSIITSRFEPSSVSFNAQPKYRAGLSNLSQITKKDLKSDEEKEIKPEKSLVTTESLNSACRISHLWIPASLLCKRFNVIPPDVGHSEKIEARAAKPILADESVEKMLNELLKDSKLNIKFDSTEQKKLTDDFQELVLDIPEDDLFDQIFGPAESQQLKGRTPALDYFEKID